MKSDNAIAVVGMACRFPGATDLSSFQRMLLDGVSAISEAPAERGFTRSEPEGGPCWGGWVDKVFDFDAQFICSSVGAKYKVVCGTEH